MNFVFSLLRNWEELWKFWSFISMKKFSWNAHDCSSAVELDHWGPLSYNRVDDTLVVVPFTHSCSQFSPVNVQLLSSLLKSKCLLWISLAESWDLIIKKWVLSHILGLKCWVFILNYFSLAWLMFHCSSSSILHCLSEFQLSIMDVSFGVIDSLLQSGDFS